MALQGTIDTFPTADVLGLLAGGRRSGRLTVTGDRGRVVLWVAEGDVVSAEVRRADLDAEATSVDPATAVLEVLRFAAGDFAFHGDADGAGGGRPEPWSAPVGLAAAVDGARERLAVWDELSARLPESDVVVAPASAVAGPVELTPGGFRLLVATARLDGATRAELRRHLGQDELDWGADLAGLVDAGLLVPGGIRAAADVIGAEPVDAEPVLDEPLPVADAPPDDLPARATEDDPPAFPERFPIDDLLGDDAPVGDWAREPSGSALPAGGDEIAPFAAAPFGAEPFAAEPFAAEPFGPDEGDFGGAFAGGAFSGGALAFREESDPAAAPLLDLTDGDRPEGVSPGDPFAVVAPTEDPAAGEPVGWVVELAPGDAGPDPAEVASGGVDPFGSATPGTTADPFDLGAPAGDAVGPGAAAELPASDAFAADAFAPEPFGAEPFTPEPFAADPFATEPFAPEPFAADPFAGLPPLGRSDAGAAAAPRRADDVHPEPPVAFAPLPGSAGGPLGGAPDLAPAADDAGVGVEHPEDPAASGTEAILRQMSRLSPKAAQAIAAALGSPADGDGRGGGAGR